MMRGFIGFGRKTRAVLLGLTILMGASPGAAQETTGTLSITLLDGVDRHLVSQAMIVVLRGDGTAPVPRSWSDPDGAARISLPAGSYTVVVRRFGYVDTQVEDVGVQVGAVRTLEIVLPVASHELNPLQVTVSRQEELANSAVQSVAIVGREVIAQRSATSPVDHIRSLPGVDVAATGLQQSNVVTRGFNNIFSGSLLVLVDNRYAHVPSLGLNATHWIPTTDLDLERIEVSLGPGAAVYGPNAATGVMHMITSSPIDRPGSSFSLASGERNLVHGSFRTAFAPNQSFGVKISGQYLRGDDWPFVDPAETDAQEADPSNPLLGARDNNLERWGGEVRMDLRTGTDNEFILTAGRNSNVNGVELSQIGAGQTLDWQYDFAQLRARSGRLSGQLFLNRTHSGDSFLLRTGGDIIDRSRMFGAQIKHSTNLGDRHELVYGIDLQRTEPRTLASITGRHEDDDILDQAGGYVYSTTHLTGQLDLVAALRVDHHNRIDEINTSPRAALVFSPKDDQTFRASFNRAFNTPTTNNLFLDVIAAPLGPGLDLRALGVPSDGFTFGTCPGGFDDLCMHALGAAAGTPLPADATLAWDQLIALIAPDLQAFLPNPGSAVETVLRRFSHCISRRMFC